ncbi:hypothetical protein ACFE04_006596 [Oxalis oulophora]
MATQTFESNVLITPSNDFLPKQQQCLHAQVIDQQCRDCGFNVGEEYGVPFPYIHPGLRLSHETATRLRDLCTHDLLRKNKLILVLDIDHTLLHAVRFDEANPSDMEYLKQREDLFMLEDLNLIVKFRPFVCTFLKEASPLFEMYLYTRGNGYYARNMATLLDPDNLYFGNRIISRDDTPSSFKTLNLIAGQERITVIVDDTKTIWPNDTNNLLLIDKYCYFALKKDPSVGGYLKTRSDESETNGALMRMLTGLKELHTRFFTIEDCRDKDIRWMLAVRRCLTLEGCRVHVRANHVHDQVEVEELYEMATKQGAKCCRVLDSSVTHVVGAYSNRGPLKKMFLVDQAWIKASYFLGQRQPEENFPIK